jgi:integrase
MSLQSIRYARWRGGKLYLNLPIPSDLRNRFQTKAGKPQTHIVEALGTGDPAKGRRLVRERAAYWELEFSKLRRGHAAELPSTLRKIQQIREGCAEAKASNNLDGLDALQGFAADLAEEVEEAQGLQAAQALYAFATSPDKLSLLEAVEVMKDAGKGTEATHVKRLHAVRELLGFLKLVDCLPGDVTDARAVAYVDWLNGQPLTLSTKQDRLSNLQGVWRFLARKRQVPAGSSPWQDHELTRTAPMTKDGTPAAGKRGWRSEEIIHLLQAQEEKGARHYTRVLFRELYVLGFTTGLRLDEIVSLTPDDLEDWPEEPEAILVNISESKTEAGVRRLPVVHPVAVELLRRRREQGLQQGGAGSVFPECRPGGPDGRLCCRRSKSASIRR